MKQYLYNLKLKTKIIVALFILFGAIAFIGSLGIHYLHKTSKNSIAMMNDNYNTLRYTREMSLALQDIVSILNLTDFVKSEKRRKFSEAVGRFERYLAMQTNNVTEDKEAQITKELAENFDHFKERVFEQLSISNDFSYEVYFQKEYLNDLLDQVYELNEQAVISKTEKANTDADQVTLYVIIIGFIFLGFVVFSLFYFPSYIANPINKLTNGIKEIARKNYSERLAVISGDEFGEMARSFNQMAEKLEEYENTNINQILTEKQRIETITSQMNEAIIGLDSDKCIVFANPIAEQLIGLSEEAMQGKTASELALKSSVFSSLVKEILNGEIVENQQLNAVSFDKDGQQLHYDKDIFLVRNADSNQENEGVDYLIILKNVTELKEQDLAKTHFMATLSHELKTPISAIGMSLNLLEDDRIGSLNEDQKDLTTTIRHNAARLLKMVNEILDISKIETGNIQLNYEITAPSLVIDRALSNVKTFVDDKSIRIKKNIQKEVPSIKLDVLKTTGVLTNFLTNALRYSQIGQSIEVEVMRQNGSVLFAVKDYGPGISEEDQPKIFQRYKRAKDDKTKGTGLGLAISKEFIEAQGGKIWFESEVGSGSKFLFTLPVNA